MAHTRLFQPALSSLMAIPFIPKQIDLNDLYTPQLLLVDTDVLACLLQTYSNSASIGLHTAEEVTRSVTSKGVIFHPESIPYGVFVRQELINEQPELALYVVCKDDQKLGAGAFGKVLPVQCISGDKKGQWFALKILKLENDQQLLNAGFEEQMIIGLGMATPSTPRSTLSDYSDDLLSESIEIKPRIVRKSHSSRGLPIFSLSEEKEPIAMQRSGSARMISPASASPTIGRVSRSLALASLSNVSSPATPTYLSSPTRHRAMSNSHSVPALNLKLKKSTEVGMQTPPSRSSSSSPFSLPFSIEDVQSNPGEDIHFEYDIFMDLIKGESVRDILENEYVVGVCSVLRLQMAIDITESLESLINSDRLHCDIKPQNIMYDRFLSKANFIDFGEAKVMNTTTRQCISEHYNGTAVFMAPELRAQAQLARNGQPAMFVANEKTEIYALGMLLADIFSELRPDELFDDLDNKPYIVSEYPICEGDEDSILSHHILDIIRGATTDNPMQRISLQTIKQKLNECRQYVEEKQINVGVFNLAAYWQADEVEKIQLFKKVVEQYEHSFHELWLIQTSPVSEEDKKYIELKRKFERSNVIVGDFIGLGKDVMQAQSEIIKHLNVLLDSRGVRGVCSVLALCEPNRLDLKP